jgi:hypothetical protein
MKPKTRRRVRPKKEEGREEFWRLVRVGEIISAYDEARENNQKHSAAVTHAVGYLRQHHPEMPISETVVKRTLATFRSRDSQATLRFKKSTINKKDLARLHHMLEQVPLVPSERGLSAPPIQCMPKSRYGPCLRQTSLRLRFTRCTRS